MVACTESSVVPPAAPSPLNPERIGELTIACSADVQVQSVDGQPVPIPFPPATTHGGEAPVSAGCTPESGASFPIARNRVNCTTSDKLGQVASCAFDVVVLPPPMLGVTKIMAFGDSLTAGVVALPISGFVRLGLEIQNSYPIKLHGRLSQAYMAQTVTTINEGLAGELAAEALPRLQSALVRHRPDLVILMEGTNDLGAPAATDDAATVGIESMLGAIASAGADAILATVPPVRPSGLGVHSALVGPYNNKLLSIAAIRGVPLVDVHALINNGNCARSSAVVPTMFRDLRTVHDSTPCVGVDNIHLTVEGYELIADAFFDRIVELYDIPVAVPTAIESVAGPSGATTWRD